MSLSVCVSRMCPIFQISNVTGENMDLLKMFLNLLSSRTSYRDDQPAEFQIDDTYSVPVRWQIYHTPKNPSLNYLKTTACVLFVPQGVGTVVSGTTLRGLIRLNDTMLLGPDPLGSFIQIAVKSIHRKRMPVKEVRGGQTASFALKKVKKGYQQEAVQCLRKKKRLIIMFMFAVSEILLLPLAQIKRSSIRKGMVMVSPKLNPQATWEFEAEILVLHHPTTISPRYQAMGEKPSQQKISKKKKEIISEENMHSPNFLWSLHSSLRQHQADGHHLVHEQGLLKDRGQSYSPLPLY